jgi:hypothetical protein
MLLSRDFAGIICPSFGISMSNKESRLCGKIPVVLGS